MIDMELKRELELYKKMYYLIFNTVTDVIEKSDDDIIKKDLIQAQQKAEEIYIMG